MRFSHRNNRLAVTGLTLYAAGLVAAITFFVVNQTSKAAMERAHQAETEAAELAKRYAGSIVLPDASGRCRRLAFDNNTGAFREGPLTACRDETPGENSTQGRINAIRDAFARR
jgi:hypothetical protein